MIFRFCDSKTHIGLFDLDAAYVPACLMIGPSKTLLTPTSRRDKFLGFVTLANFPVDALRTRSSSDCHSFKIWVTNLCCSWASPLPMAANATSRLFSVPAGPNGFHQIVDFSMFQACPTWYQKTIGHSILNIWMLNFSEPP